MVRLVYTVVLAPETDPRGRGYNVRVPALPGCFTQGDTVEEALAMAKDAIEVATRGLIEDGEDVPEGDAFPIVASVEVAPVGAAVA